MVIIDTLASGGSVVEAQAVHNDIAGKIDGTRTSAPLNIAIKVYMYIQFDKSLDWWATMELMYSTAATISTNGKELTSIAEITTKNNLPRRVLLR